MHLIDTPIHQNTKNTMSLKLILPALFLLVIVIAFGCKSQKNSKEDIPGSDEVAMIFGNSGGFSGQTNKYKLYEDGKVYKWISGDSYEALKPLDSNLAGQFFSNFTTLGFDRTEMNDPGNMTYFIVVEVGDRRKKLAWGGMNKEMPNGLETYYRNFMKTMKKHNLAVDM